LEELDKVRKFLDRDRACSVCSHLERTLHPIVFSLPEFPVKTLGSTGELNMQGVVFIDLMFTTCDNCGHVDFFNAHQLGVIVGDKKVL